MAATAAERGWRAELARREQEAMRELWGAMHELEGRGERKRRGRHGTTSRPPGWRDERQQRDEERDRKMAKIQMTALPLTDYLLTDSPNKTYNLDLGA